MSRTLSVTTAYNKTDQTRTYSFGVNDSLTPDTAQAKIIALNASLSGGTATELANLFVADDYDEEENIGTLASITSAKMIIITETPISS